jgi:hypothetical protein
MARIAQIHRLVLNRNLKEPAQFRQRILVVLPFARNGKDDEVVPETL